MLIIRTKIVRTYFGRPENPTTEPKASIMLKKRPNQTVWIFRFFNSRDWQESRDFDTCSYGLIRQYELSTTWLKGGRHCGSCLFYDSFGAKDGLGDSKPKWPGLNPVTKTKSQAKRRSIFMVQEKRNRFLILIKDNLRLLLTWSMGGQILPLSDATDLTRVSHSMPVVPGVATGTFA